MSVTLEISIGEALDKLTILEIKKEKISDPNRLKNIEKEYDYLFNFLKEIYDNNLYHYNSLKKINLEVWDLQDLIRAEIQVTDPQYASLCQKLFNLNDSRFLIKNKLNTLCKSTFLEQKGYNKRVLTIDSRYCSLEQQQSILQEVLTFSTFYDKVDLLVDYKLQDDIRLLYNNDPSVSLSVGYFSPSMCGHDYIILFDKNNNKITHSYFVGKELKIYDLI